VRALALCRAQPLRHVGAGTRQRVRLCGLRRDAVLRRLFRLTAISSLCCVQLTRAIRFDFSTASKHLNKNRYPNILAIEQTRVKLADESSYINANYLTLGASVYIATQAPLPETIADFWGMALEQRSPGDARVLRARVN
jgi:hypothetical protein